MSTAASLAQAHMASQVADAAKIQAGLALAFDKTLSPTALDATFPTYLRSSLALVTAGRNKAAKTATDYYGAAKRGAGYDSVVPLLGTPKMDLAQATQSLLMNGPVSIKKQLSTGIGLSEAVRVAKAQTLRAGKKLTLDAGREKLIDLTKKDKDAKAWARVSDGQPCYFCAMLVSRGPVYGADTVRFRAHNGCGCSVRPVFKNDADGGWSPDARALNDLWTGKFDPDRPAFSTLSVNEWRSYYGKAVSDPSSKVFQTFTDKVATHISQPSIVAARNTAAEAYATQRAAQKAAEDAARAATTKAAQEAAEAEAKAAAKEAAKVKKWKGKPAPVKPLEPPKPADTVGAVAFDPWLEKVKARYSAFAKATGNPKTQLEQSLNWTHVRKVIDGHDQSALTFLKANHYIDDDLYKEALAAMKAADAPVPGAAEAYKKALTSYKRRTTTYKRNLEDWREVNGVTSNLKGMDSGKRFASDYEGTQWANDTLKLATGAERDAVLQYTGSSYRPWNDALRSTADANKLPAGRFKTLTGEADGAFTGVPEDLVVFRGTGWNEFAQADGARLTRMPPPPPQSLIGTVHTQHGYMSTSVGTSAAFSGDVQLKILVPEGHGATWCDPYSRFKGERELLLQRGTSTFIHDVYQDSRGQWVVEAEVLPMDVDPKTFVGTPSAPASKGWK